MTLIYIGAGKHITGLPARDLSQDDIESYAVRIQETSNKAEKQLIKSGLYQKVTKPKTETKDND